MKKRAEGFQLGVASYYYYLEFRGFAYYDVIRFRFILRFARSKLLLTQVVKGMREYIYFPELGYRFDYIFL